MAAENLGLLSRRLQICMRPGAGTGLGRLWVHLSYMPLPAMHTCHPGHLPCAASPCWKLPCWGVQAHPPPECQTRSWRAWTLSPHRHSCWRSGCSTDICRAKQWLCQATKSPQSSASWLQPESSIDQQSTIALPVGILDDVLPYEVQSAIRCSTQLSNAVPGTEAQAVLQIFHDYVPNNPSSINSSDSRCFATFSLLHRLLGTRRSAIFWHTFHLASPAGRETAGSCLLESSCAAVLPGRWGCRRRR